MTTPAAGPAGGPFDESTYDDPGSGRRLPQPKLLILGAVALVALLVGGFLVGPKLLGGSPAADSSGLVASARHPSASPTPSPSVQSKPYAGALGRDPFNPLVTAAAAGTAPSAAPAAVAPAAAPAAPVVSGGALPGSTSGQVPVIILTKPPTTSAPTPTPTASPTPACTSWPTASPSPSPTVSPSPVVRTPGTTQVTLASISCSNGTPSAHTTVTTDTGTVSYQSTAGQTFTNGTVTYTVKAIDSPTGCVLYGDSAHQGYFALCAGQSVYR